MSGSHGPESSSVPPPEPERSRGLVDPPAIRPSPEGILPDPSGMSPAGPDPGPRGVVTDGSADQRREEAHDTQHTDPGSG